MSARSRLIHRATNPSRGRHRGAGRAVRAFARRTVVACTAAAMLLALTIVGLAASTVGVGTAAAAPGNPGTPGDPTTLYTEDFENGQGATSRLLTDYTGAAPQNETYTADPAWLTECNGDVLHFTTTDGGNCASVPESSAVHQLADALGQLNGSADPTANDAVAAYTDGNPGAGKVEFATAKPIALPDANGRFVTFSVNSAAASCDNPPPDNSPPLYQFSLLNGANATPVGGVINACSSGQTVTTPAIGGTPAATDHVGSYTSNGSVLFTGSSLGLQLVNNQGSGLGNDAAFDDIKILDVTPQLDKAFSPSTIDVGKTSTLTFTVTNTSELAAKDGWSFTDNLPAGVVVANPANTGGTCGATTTATAGGTAVTGTGNLNAGEASCTVTVDVTAAAVGSYTNGPDNVVPVVGLNPPGPATLIVQDPPPFTCSSDGFLIQTPTGTNDHSITPVNLVTGAPGTAIVGDRSVNGVGYNTLDNYMYGFGANQVGVVRIGSNGDSVVLGKPAAGTGTNAQSLLNSADVGDFDADGHLWAELSTSMTWEEIDLSDPSSPTYNTVLKSGTTNVPSTVTSLTSDWTFAKGAFYGVTSNGTDGFSHLLKFDPATGRTTDAGPLPVLGGPTDVNRQTGAFGAAYADSDGNVYVGNNTSGEIFRINPTTLVTNALAAGPASGGNDGARCADAPIPTITIVKKVVGRVQAADQFVLTLAGPPVGNDLTSATTTGTETTATANYPVRPSADYTITDAMTDDSPDALSSYDFSISCVNDATGAAVATTGNGPTWGVSSDAAADALTCTVSNAAAKPSYSLTKTASATGAVDPGDTVTYTVTVANTGRVPYTAGNPASFTDDLSKVIDDATYNDDAAASAGAVTYTKPTISWSGPLPVGATVTVTYSVTVNAPDTGNKSLDNGVVPPPPPPGGGGGTCATPAACTTHVPVRDYVLSKTVDTPVLTPGEKVTYTITVKSTGQAAYTAADPATFTDDLTRVLDDAAFDNDQAASGGTVTYAAPTVSWSGALDVGQTIIVTYSVTVNDPDTGDQKLINGVVGGDNCTTNPAPECMTTVPDGKLEIHKTSSVQHAAPGQKVSYTVTVKNVGQNDFTTEHPGTISDDMTDVVDDATYNNDAKASAGSVSYTKPKLTFTGPLKVGATVTITYSVKVNKPDTGNMVLKNVIPPGPTPTNCPSVACDPPPVPVEQYHVRKTSSMSMAHPGDTVHYTVTVTNTGKFAYTTGDPASFVDNMTKVLDDAAYNHDAKASAGKTSYKAPKLSWSGPLPVGGKVTVKYSITIDNPDRGDGKLLNVLTTPPPPGVPGTGITTANCPPGSAPAADCQTNTGIEAAAAHNPSSNGGTAYTGNPTMVELLVGVIALAAGGFACLAGLRRRRV